MKKTSEISKSAGNMVANAALNVAKRASQQFSFIFFQEEIPDKVKELKK